MISSDSFPSDRIAKLLFYPDQYSVNLTKIDTVLQLGKSYFIHTQAEYYIYEVGTFINSEELEITWVDSICLVSWYDQGVLSYSPAGDYEGLQFVTKNSFYKMVGGNVADTTDEEVLAFAEEMPEFKGGEGAFQAYLQNNMRYPQAEKEMGKEGTVYVYFEVGKDGTIGNVSTKKGVAGAPGLSKEAERLIRSMPLWSPGSMNGRPVKVSKTVPVKFILH